MPDNSSLKDKFLYKFYPKALYRKATYSQAGEDLLIKNCLSFLEIDKPGYLDIGAHHPYYLNNTALLYEEGFTGINVEPNPVLFQYFETFRKKDVNLNIGVGNTKGEEKFYIVSPTTLSTFSKQEADDYVQKGHSILETPTVKIDTIPNIIKAYNGGQFPELLSIDIEGLDYDILNSLDLSTNYPKVICAETTKYDVNINLQNKDQRLIELLISKGYTVFADTFVNTIFFKK